MSEIVDRELHRARRIFRINDADFVLVMTIPQRVVVEMELSQLWHSAQVVQKFGPSIILGVNEDSKESEKLQRFAATPESYEQTCKV